MTQEEQEAGALKGYSEAELKKRLAQYREANCKEDGTPSLADFFKERGIIPLTINIDEKSQEVIFEQLKVFIERVLLMKLYFIL